MKLLAIQWMAGLLLLMIATAIYFQVMNPPSSGIHCGGAVEAEEPRGVCGNAFMNSSKYKRDTTISVAEGKALFKANCAQCHAKDMRSKLTGPALGGVEQRWASYPEEDLFNFIRNSQKMIHSKHPEAEKLWEEWQPTVMNNFPNLTDEEIKSILLYIGG